MDIQRSATRLALSLSLLLGVIVIAPVATSAPVVRAAEPSIAGTPVDCDNTVPGETVVDTSAALEKALEEIGGTIAVRPGTYAISATITASVRLTSCDFGQRALVMPDDGSRGVSAIAIDFPTTGTTLHVHDIDFRMIGRNPRLLSVFGENEMIVVNANFDHDPGEFSTGNGPAVLFDRNSTGEVHNANFADVGSAITALSSRDVLIADVVIRDTADTGIFLRGGEVGTDFFDLDPTATISNTTIVGAGRVRTAPGLEVAGVGLDLSDSQVGCSTGNNIGLESARNPPGFRRPTQGAVALKNADGAFIMDLDNVNVGFVTGPNAPAKCVNDGNGIVVRGDVDVTISNSDIRQHVANNGVVATDTTTTDVVLDNVVVTENGVGVFLDAPVQLSDSQIIDNSVDCAGDATLIRTGTTTDSDGTCGGGSNPDGAIDCDNPPPEVIVVDDAAGLTAALLKSDARIALRSGTYEIGAGGAFGVVDITSCDRAKPAVLRNTPKSVLLTANGTTLTISHVDMELSSDGGTLVQSTGGDITLDNVRARSLAPDPELADIALLVQVSTSATVTNSSFDGFGRAIVTEPRFAGLTLDNVVIVNSSQAAVVVRGSRLAETNVPVKILNSVFAYNGRNGPNFGAIIVERIGITMVDSVIACNFGTGVELYLDAVDRIPSELQNVSIGSFPAGVDNPLTEPCVNGGIGLYATGADVQMNQGSVEMGETVPGVVLDEFGPVTIRFDGTAISGNLVGVDSDDPYTLKDVVFGSNGSDCAGVTLPTLLGSVPNDGTCGDDGTFPELKIVAVDGLSNTIAGPRLRAQADKPIEFRIDAAAPVAGVPLVVPWTIEGLADVVPGYRALAPAEIRAAAGTVTLQPGDTSATFSLSMDSIETLDHAGFQIWIGDGSEQSIDGIVIREPELEIGNFDGPFEVFPYQSVTEGNNIVWNLKMSPASPFLEDEYRVRWAFDLLGEPDAIDADDLESTTGEVDFLFNAALADTPASSTRTLIIPTIINAGDAAVEFFFFDADFYDTEDPTGSISLAGGRGQINDAGDPDPLSDLTIVAVAGLTDTFVVPVAPDGPVGPPAPPIAVLRADVDETVRIRVEASEPVAGQPLTVPWTVSGRLGTVPGFFALPAEDITDKSGTVTLPVGATSATFDVMVAADDPGETAGFVMSIGDSDGQSINGLLVGGRSVSVTPTDPNGPRFESNLLVAEGDPIEVDITVLPADPFVDAVKTIRWTLEPGDVDGIDADDVASVVDVFEIDFDPATDGPEGSTRTVSVATETNTGDLSYETFSFDALLRDGDTGALAISGLDGGIADRIGTTISAVDALTDSTVGRLLRADVGERVQFRVDLDEPAVGGRSVAWQIFGEIGVVPGFRGIEADEITEQSGAVTIEPGASSATFDVMVAATDPNETVGFRIRVGNGADQEVTGLLVGIPMLIGTHQTEPVNEGDPIEAEIRLSPANPFFDDADRYPWTLGPGAIDGIDADDVAAVSGNAEFVFDPATDSPQIMDRIITIGTLRNTGDAPLESFEFEIESRNAEVSAEVLGAIGVSGQIADAPDNDDAPTVSVQPSDEWQLDLGDGVDAVVLIDGDDASSVEVSIDSPRATRTELTWAIEGTEVDGERAATTTGPGNDFQQITGTFAIPAGATSTTVFLRSEADDADEPHEGFTFSITSGAAEVVSIPGLIETDSFSVRAAPTDGDDDDLLIGVPAEGTIDATITITPAPLLRTSFIQDWQLVGNGAFGDGPATAADFAATSGSLGLGIDAVLDGSGASLASVTGQLTIDVVDDGVAEPSEGFELVLPSTDGTEAQVLLGVIYDGAEPTAEEGTSFGGLKVADVKGDVESDENGPTGTARGKIKLPSFNLELPVDIVFANGAVTVTYEDTLDDIDLSSGEGAAAVQYLGLEAPAVKVQATATARGKVSAFVELSAATGTLFPNSASIPIEATIDKPIVTINSNTVIVMSARAVSGTFEAVTVTGLQPRLIISPDPTVPLLTVDDITASGGLTLTGLKVSRTGAVEFDRACVNPNNWLNGSLDVIGLPLSIDTACVFSDAEGTQAKITGSLDQGALAPLDATITIGDGLTNTVDALFDIKGPAITPRDLGPIKITLNEFETNGYTASGFFTIQGYQDGVLNPNFSGEFTIGTPEGDTVDSNVSGNITSTGNGLSATTLVDVFLDVAFEGAADNIGLDSDLLTVDDASLGLNFGIETTETTVINEAVASTGGLLDLFNPNAPSNDPTNAYVLAVLNHYLYLDSYGLTPTPTDAQFADVLRPVVEGFGGELVDFFVGDQGVQGAIIRNNTALIVVGRGSDTLQDYTLQAVGALPNSTGEHRAVAEAADVMQDAITAALADRGSRALWFTGHSYGGALASIVVGRMQGTVDIDGLVTFGAPAPFTAERVAAEATDPTSALMQATRWDNQSDPIPLLYVPGLYFHQNDPNRIVMALDGVCSIEPTFLDLTTDVDADDHSIARYALRLLNLSAPADRTAILSTQRDDLTVTVVPIADVPAASTANCDAAPPFTKATTASIIGPVVTSAGAGIVLRIPGVTDDAGQAIEIGATVSFDNGVWTAEAILDPEVAYRFGGFRLTDLTGALEVDTNTGAATPTAGSFSASIEIPAAEGEPIPIDVALTFATNAEGLLKVDVVGNLDFTGELFGGALTVVTATLAVTADTTIDPTDIASSTLAVTALLDLKGAKLELGAFEVELGDVAFNYDGDPATPLFSAASIEGRIADPSDPTKTLLGVTITGLVLNDDGTVNVTEINVRNLDDLQREFALAGVLPYIVSEITLTTTNGDFNSFTLDVEGNVDLTVFGDRDIRFSATTGTPAATVPVGRTCAVDDDEKQFPLDFSIDVTSARDFQFAPRDLSNIVLGVCDLEVGPMVVSGAINLGGYVDGVFQSDFGGSLDVAADLDGGAITAGVDITGDLVFGNNGAARLDLAANFEFSGELDDIIEITDASLGLAFGVDYDPNSSPKVSFDDFEITGGSVGDVEIDLGDFVTLKSNGVKLFPEPGVLVSVVGPVNGNDDDSAFFSAVLGEDAGPLVGWGGSAGNFKIVTDPVTGIDVELHPGFFINIEGGATPDVGLPEWLPFVVRDAGISWPDLELTEDGLGVTEPVRLRTLITNLGEAEITFSGGLTSEGSNFPFDAQVDGLVIDIGALTRYIGGNPRDDDSVIKDLKGIKLGMEPTEFGPLTVGGTIAVGSEPVEGGDPVFYLEASGTFGFDGIEVGGTLVVSQYGPVALEFAAPLAVPLGPSGFVLSGVSGGVDFLTSFPSIEIDCTPTDVGDEGDSAISCGQGPLDLLNDNAFPTKFAFDKSKLAEDAAARQADQANGGSPFIPRAFTVRIGGQLTHIGAGGVITGDVTMVANLSTSDDDAGNSGGLKFLGVGEISAVGLDAGAEARFLIDLSTPIEPKFTVALQVPTADGWIGAVLPVQAQVGMTVDTKGLAPGMVLALRQFLIRNLESEAITEVLLPRLAVILEADHSLELSRLLLDTGVGDAVGNPTPGSINPVENEQVITADFIMERLVGDDDPLLVDFTDAGGVGAVLESDITLAVQVAHAFISDLFAIADGQLDGALVDVEFDFAPLSELDAKALLDDFLETALDALVGEDGALAALFATADPKLLIQGDIQVQAFGLPIGSPNALNVYIDKNQLIFEATGSIWAQLRSGCGVPGCSPALYAAFLGLNDTTTGSVAIPFKLEKLLAGESPIDGPWAVGLSSELSVFGLPLGTATGFIVPPGNPTFVDQQLAAELPNGTKKFVIPVSDKKRAEIAKTGGIVFEGNLRLPDFVTNPASTLKKLSDRCTTVPDKLTDIPGWISECFDIAGETSPIGAVQGYLPAPDLTGIENVSNQDELDDFIAGVTAQLDNAYLQGRVGSEEDSFKILGLPLGEADVSASTKGLSLSGEVFGADVDFDIILPTGDGDDAALADRYPRVGANVVLDTNDLGVVLEELGFDKVFPTKGTQITGRFTAYSPGFDTTTDAIPLQRSGGVELAFTANIDTAGFSATDASVIVRVTPSRTGILDVTARFSVLEAEFGGFTVDNAFAELSFVGGELSGAVSGSFKLPGSFTNGAGQSTVSVDGSFSLEGFSLGIAANQLKLGPVALSGALTITGSGSSATLDIGPGENATVAMISVASLGTFRTSGISVSPTGEFSVNLQIDEFGVDALQVAGVDFTVAGRFVTVPASTTKKYTLSLSLAPGAQLSVKPLSSVQTKTFAFPSFTKELSLDDLAFSRTFTVPAIDLGSFMRTTPVEATVAFEDGALSLEQGSGTATITVLGASASIRGLVISTDGTVDGTITGNLSVFNNTLTSVSGDLSQVEDENGDPVLKLMFSARMKLELIKTTINFNGYVRSDGQFEINGDSEGEIKTPRLVGPTIFGFRIPDVPPLNLASYDGNVTLDNIGGLSGSFEGRVCIITSCAQASGRVDDRGVVSGVVQFGSGGIPHSFNFPRGERLNDAPDTPTPVFTSTVDDFAVYVSLPPVSPLFPTAPAPTTATANYHLPTADNALSVECFPASGTAFDLGTTLVRCEARGESEAAYTQFRVSVLTLGTVLGSAIPDPAVTNASGATVPNNVDGLLVVEKGDTIKGEGGPFAPKGKVDKTVFSDPIFLGTETAGDDGIVDWSITIPDELPAGQHTLVLTGENIDGVVVLYNVPLLVNEVTPEPAGELPATGSTGISTIVWLAVLLMLLGSVLLVGRRRRGPRATMS